MPTVTLVHHRVADFAAWKQVYDAVKPVQQAGGVTAHAVLRGATDPNMVVVCHTFDTAAKAQAFFQSSELKDAMAKAGVDMASFQLEILDEVVSGAL